MIREAKKTDAFEIADVHVSTWRHSYRGIMPQTYLDALCSETRSKSWGSRIEDPNTYIKVYTVGDVICGFIAGGVCRDENLAGFDEIYAVYVLPGNQRNGVGLALTMAFLDEHPNSCSLWVLADNISAVKFYRSVGFHPDGHTKKITIDGKELEEHRYIRLSPNNREHKTRR